MNNPAQQYPMMNARQDISHSNSGTSNGSGSNLSDSRNYSTDSSGSNLLNLQETTSYQGPSPTQAAATTTNAHLALQAPSSSDSTLGGLAPNVVPPPIHNAVSSSSGVPPRPQPSMDSNLRQRSSGTTGNEQFVPAPKSFSSLVQQQYAPLTPAQRIEKRPIRIVTRSADEETEDGRVRNREAMQKIRDAWIYKQIRARQDEFTQYRKTRLFVGSWNVNAKIADSLEEWLCHDWGERNENAPDIVVVGFQEVVDLNAVNVAVDNKTQQRSQFWIDKIRSTLNNKLGGYNSGNDPMNTYSLLVYKHLVGLLLCVFVKTVHHNRVKYLHSSTVGVGVMGMMGNKGGVAIRFQFYDSTFCFVNSHLAAHRENTIGRNADFSNILAKTTFDIGEEAVREVIRSGSLRQWALGSSIVTIPDHDLVFWLGDLNYRIDEPIPTDVVMDWSNNSKLHELRTNDQLNLERAGGRVFQGFSEGQLRFKPTYKYQPGTDLYDVRPDKKIRAPAWCDRVLWLSQEPSWVNQESYTRAELNMSDHKPIMSTFVNTIKEVIPPKRDAVYEEVLKMLDKFENATLPMVGLDKIVLDYGELRYDQTATQQIKITNTGKVMAQFRFVPKLDEVEVCKSWAKIDPMFGMLMPGETMSINFKITVDNTTANDLNLGREVLEDIVILRLENGRDYYVTISAQYARSCFGMSLDQLVMYTEPIRCVPLDPVKRAEYIESNGAHTSTAAALCVPKELWRIIDAIYQKGLHEKDLFSMAGYPNEVSEIIECLDTGTSFAEYHIHSMCEVLISFLSNLSTPVVPRTMFPAVEIDPQNIYMWARKFLEDLPPIHYNVFVYIISFFRECLLHKETNGLLAPKVARICVNCMVVGAQGSTTAIDESSVSTQRRAGLQMIMQHFLEANAI